jgi:hypothetical protein
MKFPVRKTDVQNLITKHCPTSPYPEKERKAEATALLSRHGPLLPRGHCRYPTWHPIARCLAAEHGVATSLDYSAPPDAIFDHDESLRWALLGWPYATEAMVSKSMAEYSKFMRMGVEWDWSETQLYNDGTPICYQLYVHPELVETWEGYTEDEWVAYLRYAIGMNFSEINSYHTRYPSCLEPYDHMQHELFGADDGERFHPAFTPRLIERMRPIYMLRQFRWIQRENDWSKAQTLDRATKKLTEEDIAILQQVLAK